MKYLLALIFIIGGISCPKSGPLQKNEIDLSLLVVPDGFKVELFASDVTNARSICIGDNGVVFVGSRKAGNVYALIDADNDHVAEQQILVAKGMNMPSGVAFKDGDLYVAEVDKIWRYPAIEKSLPKIPNPELITDQYPTDGHHGWKYIAFGPDDLLYVPVGAPCNICESAEIYASITTFNMENGDIDVIAHGVRNSVGFDWHPETKELWFTDNGRDWMGDNSPDCELNRLEKNGGHFGYPYCHAEGIQDPKFGEGVNCDEYIPAALNLGPHIAPVGMEFYHGSMLPESFTNKALIAQHGSWNRSDKIGYRIMMADINDQQQAVNYSPFITGWLQGGDSVWGRPVDLETMPDGSILISDDYADCIYRVSYE